MQYAWHMGLAVPRHTGMAPGPGHRAGVGYGTWDRNAARETKDPSRLRGAHAHSLVPAAAAAAAAGRHAHIRGVSFRTCKANS